MVALITQQSHDMDSTDLWGTLNGISEALGNTLAVVSHFLGEEVLGNATNSSLALPENYTETVSTLLVTSWKA